MSLDLSGLFDEEKDKHLILYEIGRGGMQAECNWLMLQPIAGFCDNGNDPAASVNGREFPDSL